MGRRHFQEQNSSLSSRLGSDNARRVVENVVGIHVASDGPPIEDLFHHGVFALDRA